MPAPKTEVLIVVDGVESARHVLTPGESDCRLQVEAGSFSRQHAKLVLNFDTALLDDLGSTSGTFVNDAPVTERTRLWPGKRIRIGTATVRLQRLQTEAPTDMSLAPAQSAFRYMLSPWFLCDRRHDTGAGVGCGGMGAILDAIEAAIRRRVAMKVMLDT